MFRVKGRDMILKRLTASLSILLLAACSDSTTGSPSGGAVAPLCIASDCTEAALVASVPDAENLLFTPDGRLFVSGGTNVFEVVRTGAASVELTALSATDCNFTGLAQRDETLYASCGSGELYAGQLTESPELTPIYTYVDTALPNGMATAADGALYVVDGPLPGNGGLPSPKILRLRFADNDPMMVVEQSTWLEAPLAFPNGLVRRGDQLYLTDADLLPPTLGVVRSVQIEADGSAGAVTTLATFNSVLDDLTVAGEDLIVTEYTSGRVVRLAPDGSERSATDLDGYSFPSSVIVGREPMFQPSEWLVTEKGVLGDTSSMAGNQLTLMRPIAP